MSCDPPATPLTPRRMSTSPRTPQIFRRSPEQSLSPQISGPSSLSRQSYGVYLSDAHNVIRHTHQDCASWSHRYDGSDLCQVYKAPIRELVKEKISVEIGRDPLEETFDCVDTNLGPGSVGGESSGYLSGSWDEGESQGGKRRTWAKTKEERARLDRESQWLPKITGGRVI